MKPLTQEWVEKAEGDFQVATQIMRRRKQRVYDAACFHAQQTVEKYLKARLCEAVVAFPKTHDLAALLKLLLPLEPLWSDLQSWLRIAQNRKSTDHQALQSSCTSSLSIAFDLGGS